MFSPGHIMLTLQVYHPTLTSGLGGDVGVAGDEAAARVCVSAFMCSSICKRDTTEYHSGQFLVVFVVTRPDICEGNTSFRQLNLVI